MTTAREIADWHRAEAQRLKADKSVASVSDVMAGRVSIAVDVTDPLDRIKLHERFAAWLEQPPIEAIDGGRNG